MIIATELQGSDFSPNLITLSDSDLLFLKRSSSAFYETDPTDLKVDKEDNFSIESFSIDSETDITDITLNQAPSSIIKHAYIIVQDTVDPFTIYYTRKITAASGNTITVDAFPDNFLKAGLSCFIYKKQFFLKNGDDGTVDADHGKTATSIDLSMRTGDVSGILPPIMITDYRIPASLYVPAGSTLSKEGFLEYIYSILLNGQPPAQAR